MPWVLPVFMASDSPKELKDVAEDFARFLFGRQNESGFVGIAESNPVCYFWIEIDPWQPVPRNEGYILRVTPTGAILQASTVEEAKSALADLKLASRSGAASRPLVPCRSLTDDPIARADRISR